MKLVIQRVQYSKLFIDKKLYSSINRGLLVLLGIEKLDSEEDIDWLIYKLVHLRIFGDHEDKMNLSVKDINGEILVVSQFTLHASTKKGNRPSFIYAAAPNIAIPLYETFIQKLSLYLKGAVKSGEFGAQMKIQMENDGPVTIIMDSKNRI